MMDDVDQSYSTLGQSSVVSADDGRKMQELTIRDRYGDKRTGIEHWQPYGVTAVPLPPANGQEAEALTAYIGGSADHPVVIAVADRRHRPTGMKPGEVALSDHQGQMVKHGESGTQVSTSKKLDLTSAQNTNVKAKKVLLNC